MFSKMKCATRTHFGNTKYLYSYLFFVSFAVKPEVLHFSPGTFQLKITPRLNRKFNEVTWPQNYSLELNSMLSNFFSPCFPLELVTDVVTIFLCNLGIGWIHFIFLMRDCKKMEKEYSCRVNDQFQKKYSDFGSSLIFKKKYSDFWIII